MKKLTWTSGQGWIKWTDTHRVSINCVALLLTYLLLHDPALLEYKMLHKSEAWMVQKQFALIHF